MKYWNIWRGRNTIMLRRLFKKKKQTDVSEKIVVEDGTKIVLKGRAIEREVNPEIGASILELAEKHGVDWNSNCRRGTCARCRCFVSEGMDHLTEPNEAERQRLEPDEISEGYRLGCQAKINEAGNVKVRHASYF